MSTRMPPWWGGPPARVRPGRCMHVGRNRERLREIAEARIQKVVALDIRGGVSAAPEWQAGRVKGGGSRLPLEALSTQPACYRASAPPVANATSMIRANGRICSKGYIKIEAIIAIGSNYQVSDYHRSPRPPLHQPQPRRNLPFSARGVRPMVLGHSVFCTTTALSYFPTLASDVAGTARRPSSLTTLLKSPSKIPYTNPEKLK